jgi:hypothetical protein
MLSQTISQAQLQADLLSREEWKPYPTWKDREAWEAIPESVRHAHISRGEEQLGYPWPSLPATLFLQYARIGNRTNYEIPHFDRRGTLSTLALAECMEGQGRFLDDIVNGIWAICEESYWGVPAHIRVQKAGNGLPDTDEPTVDLFAAETGSLLAWVDYLLGDRLDTVSPLVRTRIAREVQSRILTPCLERDDFWWMGFVDRGRPVNNWNPWVCSNWLAATLLLEPDDERRVNAVYKIMRAVDNFIDPYPRDGGCDEGPNYWGRAGASLFDNLELLYSASGGAFDFYAEPLVKEIGRFIYRAHIADDFYVNFADASAIVDPEPLLVLRYGQRIDDGAMQIFGAWLAERQSVMNLGIITGTGRVPPSLGRALPDLFALADLPDATPEPPLIRDVWLPEIQVMAARDMEGRADGFYVAAKGGHNEESHNHNDVGNFVVYIDGKPLLVDAGVETYTAKTFSPQRYDIWTMQSAYHSLLPTIDGIQQLPGDTFRARDVEYSDNGVSVCLSLDIAGAYPDSAGIVEWRRSITLLRGSHVEISDDFVLAGADAEIVLSLLTPSVVDLSTPGLIALGATSFAGERQAASGRVSYVAEIFEASLEEVPISDERMGPVWGSSLNRVLLRADGVSGSGNWRFVVRSK